jgi:hypothetical protein
LYFQEGYFIVTEIADGGDVSELLKDKKMNNDTLTTTEVADMMWQISDAMKYLHCCIDFHLKFYFIFALAKNGRPSNGATSKRKFDLQSQDAKLTLY